MNDQRIQYLLQQQMYQRLTEAEQEELRQLLESEEEAVIRALVEHIDEESKSPMIVDSKVMDASFHKVMASDKVTMLEEAIPRIPAVHRVHFLRKWGWVAASILLVLSVGVYFLGKNNSKKDRLPGVVLKKAEIQPGKDGAILTLADGSLISLDTIQNGTIALQGGVTARMVNGALVYEGTGHEMVYNTMSTPRGRQFRITLPDGTGVWLNAASSIRYPTVFTGKERVVEISGEVYFEVAKNKHLPFKVNVDNKQMVEVLGTHFNINAYENERNITTTLLEGSVRIGKHQSAGGKENAVVLKPGEQAIGAAGSPLTIDHSPDLDKVMAWKNGVFNFENTTLEEAMRQLARWYDIEVVYQQPVPKLQPGGTIKRSLPFTDVLYFLENVGLHYKLEGSRKLIILPG